MNANSSVTASRMSRFAALQNWFRADETRRLRAVLCSVGGLIILLNSLAMLWNAEFIDDRCAAMFAERGLRIAEVDPARLERIRNGALLVSQAINGGLILVGAGFIALAPFVRRRPVAVMVAAVALYVPQCLATFIKPETDTQGMMAWIIPCIVLGGLIRSARIAKTYVRQRSAAAVISSVPAA